MDVATAKDRFALKPDRPDDWFTGLEYAPDGKQLLTSEAGLGDRLWDAETGKPLDRLDHDSRRFTRQAFSADGRRLLTFDESARVWDTAGGHPVATFRPAAGTIHSADLSHDGLRALTVTEDGTLQVWDVAGGTRDVAGPTTVGPASGCRAMPPRSSAPTGGRCWWPPAGGRPGCGTSEASSRAAPRTP